jgi:hypothetical protein
MRILYVLVTVTVCAGHKTQGMWATCTGPGTISRAAASRDATLHGRHAHEKRAARRTASILGRSGRTPTIFDGTVQHSLSRRAPRADVKSVPGPLNDIHKRAHKIISIDSHAACHIRSPRKRESAAHSSKRGTANARRCSTQARVRTVQGSRGCDSDTDADS